ncbi:hypothetical protein P872_13010 [Rhodonellum psychrophilum GCM71 = DSM 17998]|uniref:Uncharacterized protein n=1 Tax=Rhodonellum psychrophilum GCM71 = DSM 17998 TaxID=1123057 RepID=U5BRH5_9BACT|nr:hypothetical protein P872_13010 [Rhodonellum psychrophilum GCM71 = DSM 17998]
MVLGNLKFLLGIGIVAGFNPMQNGLKSDEKRLYKPEENQAI